MSTTTQRAANVVAEESIAASLSDASSGASRDVSIEFSSSFAQDYPVRPIQVAAGDDYLFRAQMPASAAVLARRPTRSGEESWEGVVFLPGCRRCSGVCGRLFLARMKGVTIAYPFLSEEDTISIRPPQEAPLLGLLLQSEFQAEEWLVRVDATHGQSDTYKRSDV